MFEGAPYPLRARKGAPVGKFAYILKNLLLPYYCSGLNEIISQNDPWVVLYQICVFFYGPRSIRGRIRGHNILHLKSMGKKESCLLLASYQIFLDTNQLSEVVSLQ